MYFSEFPTIFYQFIINGVPVMKTMRDITLNVRPIKEVVDNVVLYQPYEISNGDTPEIIADKVYGDPQLHWVIMLVNEKYDYLNDFPMTDQLLSDYVTATYGAGHENDNHLLFGRVHYQYNGKNVDSTYPGAVPVSNYDYEFGLNEDKRHIRIVSPVYVNIFVQDIGEAFNKDV